MNSALDSKKLLTRAGLLSSGFTSFLDLQTITELGLKTCVQVAEEEAKRGLLDQLFE